MIFTLMTLIYKYFSSNIVVNIGHRCESTAEMLLESHAFKYLVPTLSTYKK